jgi:isoleucyl-tRNA synthetase
MPSFAPVSPEVSFPEQEERILALWEKLQAFPRSVAARPADKSFIFYDGPPFATGLPHYGHLVASTLKDIVPRYWTMRGMKVERRFGWDTHGLPIEMEMEKALGLSGPSSIRAYGVDKFNEACRENVLRYVSEWRRTVTRVGRWVDFDRDYKTMDLSFMESVWWVFSELWKKGLVYQGVRVMPFSWRLSTPLSNFEANLDYRDVDDPALTVKLKLVDDDAALLIWTTTPWTLPSNLAVAVGADVDYVRATTDAGTFIVAADLAQTVLGAHEVAARMKGRELVGKRYAPLFPYFAQTPGAFQVITAPHVTTDDGTGLVHMAPAFGEEDFAACKAVGIEPIDPIDEEGRFTDRVPDFVGQNVKDADKNIIAALKKSGALFKQATIRHSYPFCWRSGTPLIYKTFPVWFVKVEQLRDRMGAANDQIHWVPDAVGTKRFGNWLKEARDWAISRNRFWGTPLPIWICEDDHKTVLSSAAELAELSGATVDDLHTHKIDGLPVGCRSCGKPARRVPDVFDCWFESGSMPYAQLHYPFENQDVFEGAFPAQFIAEGLDQTRGWFYTLLVLSTALYDKAPFSNVIVNGLVLAEDGAKMSKSKKNYPDPMEVVGKIGADALRAYLINSPVVRAEPLRFSEAGVREVVRTVLLPLHNAWSFFVQYANADGWKPQDAADAPPLAQRPELDRWILSVLQSLIDDANKQMEGYYLYKVVPPMMSFIDDLTNWYIRRSRRRFWRSGDDADKRSAYATLYEVLVEFAKVLAPVLPFVTEAIWQNLVVAPGVQAPDSVHLADYPIGDAAKIDRALESRMATARAVVRLGRALREKHKLKTRQPLPSVTVVSHDPAARAGVQDHVELIREELNVKDVVVLEDDADLATLSFKANFKTLGKRMGKKMKEAAAAIEQLARADFEALQKGFELEVAGEKIALEDVLVTRAARGDVVLEAEGELTVALDTRVDEALKREGLVRDVIREVQDARKRGGFAMGERIVLTLETADDELRAALRDAADVIAGEVLANEVRCTPWSEQQPAGNASAPFSFTNVTVGDAELRIHLHRHTAEA